MKLEIREVEKAYSRVWDVLSPGHPDALKSLEFLGAELGRCYTLLDEIRGLEMERGWQFGRLSPVVGFIDFLRRRSHEVEPKCRDVPECPSCQAELVEKSGLRADGRGMCSVCRELFGWFSSSNGGIDTKWCTWRLPADEVCRIWPEFEKMFPT